MYIFVKYGVVVLCSLSILVFLLFLNTHFSKFLFGIVFVLFLRENSFSYALGELGKSERERIIEVSTIENFLKTPVEP